MDPEIAEVAKQRRAVEKCPVNDEEDRFAQCMLASMSKKAVLVYSETNLKGPTVEMSIRGDNSSY